MSLPTFEESPILIVDDEPDFRAEIVFRLRCQGCQCIAEAGTVAEALECVRQTPPGVVLTDMRMPGCTGADLVAILRRSVNDVLPVIVCMTAYSDLTIEEWYKRKVDAVFIKPFRIDDLVSGCRHLYDLRRSLALFRDVKGHGGARFFLDQISIFFAFHESRTEELIADIARGATSIETVQKGLLQLSLRNRRIESLLNGLQVLLSAESSNEFVAADICGLLRTLYSHIEQSERLGQSNFALNLPTGEVNVTCNPRVMREILKLITSEILAGEKCFQLQFSVDIVDAHAHLECFVRRPMSERLTGLDSFWNETLGVSLGLFRVLAEIHGGRTLVVRQDDALRWSLEFVLA